MNSILEQHQVQKEVLRKINWWQAIAFMFAGGLLVIAIAVISFFLLAGVPATNIPIVQPEPTGKTDLTGRVSQEYVNREIMSNLSKNPVSVLGVGEVNQVVLQFNADSVIDVTSHFSVLGKQFDLKIKDRVFVTDNKVNIMLVEEPKLDGLGLPVQLLKGMVDGFNTRIADQINQQLIGLGKTLDCDGKPLGRTPTLLKVSVEPGMLEADFSIKIAA